MRSFILILSLGGGAAAALLAACTTFGTETPMTDAGGDAPGRPGAVAPDGGSKDSSTGADVVSNEGGPVSGCPDGRARVFVTSGAFGAKTLSGQGVSPQESADAICNEHAKRGGMPGTVWTAWLSSQTKSTLSSMPLSVAGFADVKCQRGIALTLGTGDLSAPINTTETGDALNSPVHTVWTGTKADGGIGATCGDWTENDSRIATTGDTEQRNFLWTDSPGVSCASSGRLYCVEGARRR